MRRAPTEIEATVLKVHATLELLENLETPERVALFLEKKNFHGARVCSRACPLFLFLESSHPEVERVTYAGIQIFEDFDRQVIPLTPLLHRFILNFDERNFPFLIR